MGDNIVDAAVLDDIYLYRVVNVAWYRRFEKSHPPELQMENVSEKCFQGLSVQKICAWRIFRATLTEEPNFGFPFT